MTPTLGKGRRRCCECRDWYVPAPSAAKTQRTCGKKCRLRRRARQEKKRREADRTNARADERERQRQHRARKRVYLAHDTRLDRDVAFALIKTDGLDDAGLARTRHEAQAMGRLGDHPHIVTVHDIGDEGTQPYIVSQFMAGGSVDELLRRTEGHRLPIDHCLRLGEQLCQALDHAHTRRVIHRDLKPGNVWLTADGTAQLGDFGLAIALDRSRLTLEGMMVGTVAYMAPEQALWRSPDARSDLYALGAMLYEMATGCSACLALTNPNPWAGSIRSPEQTRPRLPKKLGSRWEFRHPHRGHGAPTPADRAYDGYG